MKAVVIHEFGGIEKLVVTDIPQPEPREGEVLVRIKAAGVNPVDYKIRIGGLQSRMPYQFPIILGWDMAGVIEKNGFGASRFEPGEAVYAYARRTMIHQGTYAEYIVLPESFLCKKPAALTFEEAAAVPLAGLTAYQSMFIKGRLKAGENVLILGATGGVGSYAIQMAKAAGANVVAVAGSKNKTYALALGASDYLDYSKDSVSEDINQKYPQKFDLVFDCVGKDALVEAYQYLKPGGRLVSILGQLDAEKAEKYKVEFHYVFVEPIARHLEQISDWIEAGKIRIPVEMKFKLEEVAKAHQLIESSHTKGKIVLTVS